MVTPTATQDPQSAYCMKCKTKRPVKDGRVVDKNGRRMLQGTCSVCNTRINRAMGKTPAAAPTSAPSVA